MPQRLPEMKKLQITQVRGAILDPRDPPAQTAVFVQGGLHTGESFELEMSLGDAMYLLNFLREIEKDSQNLPK